MIWVGLILGAIFGWAGILFAAVTWFLLSLAKLAVLQIVFTLQVTAAIIKFVVEVMVSILQFVAGRMNLRDSERLK